MSWVIDGNEREFAVLTDVLDRQRTLDLTRRCTAALHQNDALLEARRAGGWVRRCHGDLHLGNVVWLDGRPVLFDAIEFNDAVACVDVWDDLAFLLMDLAHRGLDAHAHAVFQRYVEAEHQLDGLTLLPLFLACRAAIGAKTTAEAVRLQPDGAAKAADERARVSRLGNRPVVAASPGAGGARRPVRFRQIDGRRPIGAAAGQRSRRRDRQQ